MEAQEEKLRHDPVARFKYRIERRIKFLKLLDQARLGIYLPPEENNRRQTVENLVRLLARSNELPHLTPAVIAETTDMLLRELEQMQSALPHDVQYRNRIRSRQVW